jgi:hypothetical protein
MAFFESNQPLPISITLARSASDRRTAAGRYSLVTGPHGDDAILRMPRGWVLLGSDDGANWTVLDRRSRESAWILNEERTFRLARPARNKYFRFDFTEPGAQPILRIYGLRLYEK